MTRDGDLITLFRKNGSTVGSIGTKSNRLYIGNGDTGLYFVPDNDSIYPWDTSTNGNRDAAIDLGQSSNRFKDLYLSGGAYLGGTAAANKLDDYEEGTWTVNNGFMMLLQESRFGATKWYIHRSRQCGTQSKISEIVALLMLFNFCSS